MTVSPPKQEPKSTRLGEQRTFWNDRYTEDMVFFGDRQSEFAEWAHALLQREGFRQGKLVELGAGYGRDLEYFHKCGFEVCGVDVSDRGVALARARLGESPARPFAVSRGDARCYLARLPGHSVDIVYSNLFYNMHFTEGDHFSLFAEVTRVLRPGGFHLYSVRSTKDPWYGRGRRRGPDTFNPRPCGVTMHFFSRAYAHRLARGYFSSVAREERREGVEDFPVRVLYSADMRNARETSDPRDRARVGRGRR